MSYVLGFSEIYHIPHETLLKIMRTLMSLFFKMKWMHLFKIRSEFEDCGRDDVVLSDDTDCGFDKYYDSNWCKRTP